MACHIVCGIRDIYIAPMCLLGMCGMDFSSSVLFRFCFDKNCGFGFGFGSVLKTVGLVFFVDQLLADLQRTVYPY